MTGISAKVRAGAIGGLTGGGVIWIYEAVVWSNIQHLLPIAAIPANATGLVFGKGVQAWLGIAAPMLGTLIHFSFAIAWGILFAWIWPYARRRGIEATLLALLYAPLLWIVMHAAIAIVSRDHPDYADPAVIIGGFMSHFFYTVPMALVVKNRLGKARIL